MNPRGAVSATNREWHDRNGSYLFAYGLGSVIVALGLMIALSPWLPRVAAIGSFLVAIMSLVTLSFLITTPRCAGYRTSAVPSTASRSCPALAGL